jgi:chromosome segregation ATPase
MSEEEYRRMRRTQEEEEERRAVIAAEQRRKSAAEKLARDNEAREKREALEKARKALEEEKRAAKLKLEKLAMEQAELRWEALGAKTTAEKQATCIHPDFWPKEQQKRKFKCGGCNQKRGPTGYKCPLCALLSCQVCLSYLTKRQAAT